MRRTPTLPRPIGTAIVGKFMMDPLLFLIKTGKELATKWSNEVCANQRSVMSAGVVNAKFIDAMPAALMSALALLCFCFIFSVTLLFGQEVTSQP